MIGTNTVCLVMMVRNEGAIIERCLSSVSAHIDHWIVADTGSDDDTVVLLQAALADIPGRCVDLPFTGFAEVRNRLVDLSRDKADYILWLDADETLNPVQTVTLEAMAAFPQEAWQVEVATGAGTFLQPRLIGTSARYVFSGALAEKVIGLEDAPRLPGMVIAHHTDGVRWRDAAMRERERLYFESALLTTPNSPSLLLPLAQTLAAQGQWFLAMNHFQACETANLGPGETWYVKYQAARMLDRADVATDRVVRAYYQAYDYNPDKIEPLVRIANRLRRDGQLTAALDIICTAVGTGTPERSYYYEPAAWLENRYLEYLRITLGLGRFGSAVEMAEQQLAQGGHRDSYVRLLSELREDALDGEAGNDAGTTVAREGVSLTYKPGTIPEATVPGPWRKLCIGMPTYDDYDGVYFTIQSLRMFHPEILDEVAFLVVDNNPTGPAAPALKKLESAMENFRYLPQTDATGTICKDYIARAANSDYVVIMDCHVLIAPGALRQLINYFDARPDCPDLVQGPLVYDDMRSIATHFKPGWSGGMYGTWDGDARGEDPDAEAFDIEMQGCGLLAFRRDAWPGFNPRFRGFGGEEGYIQEKFRQGGGRSLCLPSLRWLHRFNRPLGVPYPSNWKDRIRNYIIGWNELGMDTPSVLSHFTELLGEASATPIFQAVEREMAGPLFAYDNIVYLPVSPVENEATLLSGLAIDKRVVRAPDVLNLDAAQRLRWLSGHLEQLANSTVRHSLIVQDLVLLASQQDFAKEALGQVTGDAPPQLLLPGSEPGRENIVLGAAGFAGFAEALLVVATEGEAEVLAEIALLEVATEEVAEVH